jgi:hypothetical protein
VTFHWRQPVLVPVLLLTVVCSAAFARSDPEGKVPSNHQDSVHLGRVTSAVRPADGLLSVNLGGRTYGTVYQIDGFLYRVSQKDLFLRLEAGPLPWLQVTAEVPYRTWSDGTGWIPSSGSGVGDGFFQLTSNHALLGKTVNVALFGGSNLPTGSVSAGLTEGAVSPHVGGALTLRLWTENQVPEMRLHLNYSQRWNRAEKTGFGMGQELFEPWFPRYQSAEIAGGNAKNDQRSLGAAVEFRKGTTSIWLEYVQDRFLRNDTIEPGEQFSAIGAGVRWGVMEGWAVRADYLASLTTDDLESAWDPAYPDLIMEFSVSRQFSIGGADCDSDGIVDRHDHCPCVAEDIDRWQDEDGCPEWDNDGDRIPDELDQAPGAPEDFDGWNDLDGIPDPDNDGDGIFDWLDSCPDEAEDLDGYRDEDGCPDEFSDRDGDGIEDSEDGCPDQPEDRDLFEDSDGCPDPDNDMDGIPDSRDKCPDLPEDYDGVDDEDGCPD